MSARYAVHGNVAVITLDNPPVNGLGFDTRRDIADGVERAQADPAVKAIVLTGAGKAFSGGADIKEFGSPKALAEPNLHSVIRLVEGSAKPVVAAINGTCMGGGLELSLACHYPSPHPRCRSRCPKSSSAWCPAPAARSACRACWASRPRST